MLFRSTIKLISLLKLLEFVRIKNLLGRLTDTYTEKGRCFDRQTIGLYCVKCIHRSICDIILYKDAVSCLYLLPAAHLSSVISWHVCGWHVLSFLLSVTKVQNGCWDAGIHRPSDYSGKHSCANLWTNHSLPPRQTHRLYSEHQNNIQP